MTHDLYLATFSSSKQRHQSLLEGSTVSQVYKEVLILPRPHPTAPTWWNRQRHRFHVGAFTETRYLYPEYHRELREMIRGVIARESVDVVYVDGLTMTQYVDAAIDVPAVVDLHDSSMLLISRMMRVEPTLKRKLLLAVDLLGIAKWERSLHKSFALIITNSRVDETHMRRLSPAGNTLTIDNGVDSEFFAPNGEMGHPERLVFTGVMNYAPNEDAATFFCDEILPRIKRRRPQVEFWIVGKDPTPQILSLSRCAGVHITGEVPDIRPYLRSASVFVCPLRYGAGIKNKILAALAMQRPVVATPVSLEGLDLRENQEVLMGNDPEDFADKVIELLQNPERAYRLAQAGQRLVTQKYSWHASARLLDEALEAVMARTAALLHRE